MSKESLFKIIFLVSFWVVVALFMTLYDWTALYYDSSTAKMLVPPSNTQLANSVASALIFTLIGGIFIASVEVLYFSKLLRRKPFGSALLIKAAFYIASIIFFTSLAFFLQVTLDSNQPLFHPEVMQDYYDFIRSPRSIMIWMFWGSSVMLALFILQVSEKLGQGVLVNFLLGKYHRPSEVDRIFMFLDLKSSTTYAEQLGHLKYSELIQDCFYDLTEVVAKHEAQIYQYVGDEAVLIWKPGTGIKDHNCVNCFFTYQGVIAGRMDYYLSKYGMVPEFKAGLDAGKVTVTEVGEIKKELAYHGDVLNTAARITSKCNDLGAKMLVSERLKTLLSDPLSESRFISMGEVQLKGKIIRVQLFNVSPAYWDRLPVENLRSLIGKAQEPSPVNLLPPKESKL